MGRVLQQSQGNDFFDDIGDFVAFLLKVLFWSLVVMGLFCVVIFIVYYIIMLIKRCCRKHSEDNEERR